MKPPVAIEFGDRRSPNTGSRFLTFLLAGLACLVAWLDYRAASREAQDLARQGREASLEVERLRRQPRRDSQAELPTETVIRINRAIIQLNLPWQELFEIFEKRSVPNVALLALEPDSRKRLLRVTAEAKRPEDMVDFLQSLLAEPRFAEVVLIRHEINKEDRNRPIRFLLEARWRMEK